MTFEPAIAKRGGGPILMSGPCSAESETQVLKTAESLLDLGLDLFRAGIWKPRTRPGSFEGIGYPALSWLAKVKQDFKVPVSTEVASSEHVRAALDHGIDTLWIGARSTANPFTVQEIADALEGKDVSILVKNPVNPDLALWIGAIERLHKAGIIRIGAIHRGFSQYGSSIFRNPPMWNIPMALKSQLPDIQLICDISHISGKRDGLNSVAQIALNLQMDGLMIETHFDPDFALSDSAQQIPPHSLFKLLQALEIRRDWCDDGLVEEQLKVIRKDIDHYDRMLVEILGKRMNLAESLGYIKLENNLAIFQPERWEQVMQNVSSSGKLNGLSMGLIEKIFQGIHEESILRQNKVMQVLPHESVEVKKFN